MEDGVKVLIADDDPHTRNLLAESLFIEGYEVEVASNGEIALERALHSHPDVIVLDRMLPGKSGDEVLASIRESPSCRKIAVFIVSGLANSADKTALLKAGADDYLAKPFAPEEVTARIGALLRRSSTQHPMLAAIEQKTIDDFTDTVTAARIVSEKIRGIPPRLKNFIILDFYRPAGEVGGDIIEYLDQNPNYLVIANGDVAGHGLPATLSMIMVRTLLRNNSLEHIPFREILPRLHRFMQYEGLPGHLASMTVARIDPEAKTWRVASAGHPAPILKRANTVKKLAPKEGTFLGVPMKNNFPLLRGRFQSGDLMLLHSDGLYEIFARGNVLEAEAAIHSIVKEAGSAEELRRTLEFAIPENPTDDVSFIVVEAAF